MDSLSIVLPPDHLSMYSSLRIGTNLLNVSIVHKLAYITAEQCSLTLLQSNVLAIN